MTTDFARDIRVMHKHYDFHEKIKDFTPEQLDTLLSFRMDFINEEVSELENAYTDGSEEDVVDALIDIIVVAIGTLDLFNVDIHKAWDEVYKANMAKERGVNPTRPNELGLPDLLKPEGWQAPSHDGNYGDLTRAFKD